MYQYEKDSSGNGIVRHIPTGKFIPYHSKIAAYDKTQSYSCDFDIWFQMSNSQRKRIKMEYCKQDCCPTLGDILEVKKPEPTYTVFINDDWCMYQEGNFPMNPFNTPKASANYNAPVAIAAVEQKTDTQTQREYLLDRWSDVERSYAYGNLRAKMRTAFNLDVDNSPKTTKELLDGITSGKYTIDAKKAELQEIAAANGGFENEDGSWTPSNDPLYAMNWGGLSPDRAGYETARDAFKGNLKAAKDTIMIGTPADGLAALQALEAWTPPAAQVANPN